MRYRSSHGHATRMRIGVFNQVSYRFWHGIGATWVRQDAQIRIRIRMLCMAKDWQMDRAPVIQINPRAWLQGNPVGL